MHALPEQHTDDADCQPHDGTANATISLSLEELASECARQFAELRAEFPGWTIEPSDEPSIPYRAIRTSGEGERLGAGTYSGLRRLLYEQDTADCERGLLALSDELKARGIPVMRPSFSVVTKTIAGIDRVISAHRGRFIGPDRQDLGALTDVDAVADRVVQLLDVQR